MSRLRIGVVGVGYLGRFHAQKLAALESADLVGVFDTNSTAAAAVAGETGSIAHDSLEQLCAQVDAMTIAASTPMHHQLATACLERGLHVFIEKPITQTSTEARQLVALAQLQNLKLQVGHIERFNPALTAARKLLSAPRFIECHRLAAFKTRGADVDVVLDLMIHDLDVILALVDSEPKNVAAMGLSVLTDTVDIANARIQFVNGAIANVTASRVSTTAQRKFRVFQANQYLSIDFGDSRIQRVTSAPSAQSNDSSDNNLNVETWELEKDDALAIELKTFVEAVINNTPVPVSGEDGTRALELAEAVLERIAAGGS